jgi:hypothetical protein
VTLVDEDLDLEFENADVVESDAVLEGPRGRTPVPFPSEAPEGFADWRAFFRTAKESVRAAEEDELDDSTPQVRARREGDVADLVRGPKKVAQTALSLGWPVKVEVIEVYVPPVLFKSTTDDHRRGDVRYEEKRLTWWTLTALAPGLPLGFHAAYLETETAKGGRGFTFDAARAADPVGMPTPLGHHYKAGKPQRLDKRETAESLAARQREMEAVAARANATYNDAADYLEHRPLFTSAKDFDLWLSDWAAMLTPTEKETAA